MIKLFVQCIYYLSKFGSLIKDYEPKKDSFNRR